MKTTWRILLVVSFLVPSVSTAERVPKARLANGVYTSPGGEYTVRIPQLIGPHIQEQQITPTTRGVAFVDDFGKTHRIVLTNNRSVGMSLEQVAADFTVGESVREKGFITTERGQELRMSGITRGGSPLVTQTKEGGKKVERTNDLVEAMSIFLHGDYICQVSAGVTPLEITEAAALERAGKALEDFMAGLEFRD